MGRTVDPATVVSSLKRLTDLVQAQSDKVKKLTHISIFIEGQTIPNSCRQEISDINTFIQDLSDADPLKDDAKAKEVLEAVKAYVQVSQQRDSIVIDKSSLFSLTPYGYPLAVAFQTLEGAGDSLFLSLFTYAGPQESALKEEADKWYKSIGQVLSSYQ